MPILEICLLKTSPNLPHTSPVFLSALQKARTLLAQKVVNTNSRFYRCIEDPSLIYILGVWPSLARHKEFLASPQKAEILDEQNELFEFQWIIHIEIGEGGMKELPLEAPILGITRLFIKGDARETYQEVVHRSASVVDEGTKPFKVVKEWRIDCEEGKFEHVFVTGWVEEGSHDAFTKTMREEHPDFAPMRDTYEGTEIKHARDMEKSF
ncbi:uncharacterized protein LY89DRAFT_687061 [Mollisia scopiformis]|uniref:ABM domain-containing protein n=1 Tax=Mollisia scopiformis TaxID=149040 RepID=A0A194X0D5_MOLSC|nr:uncharacterized protein LY89DRAFT_687061 [Mollisia scopiformis]KUJ13653.1 hypothetical protein LY89DRAFT_687061 [Mollisia scopiformis]